MGSVQRRIVAVAKETTRGTFVASMNAFNSGLPTIRSAKVTPRPIRIDRQTLRLSLTDVADIYSGQSAVEIVFIAEIGGIPQNTGANPQTYQSPIWSDLLRACGFEEVSNSTGKNPKIYTGFNAIGLTGGTAGSPIRHGETVAVDYATSGDFNATAVGDFYAEDDLMCLDEPVGQVAGTGAITLVGATSGRSSSGTIVRDTSVVVAFRLRSDIDNMEAASIEVYVDGKRWQVKGCMGNAEFRFIHGDVLHAEFNMQGVLRSPATTGYADVAIPTNANENHYIPPVFLGRDVRIHTISASPQLYGKRSLTGQQIGSFNRMNLRTGNDVILRENSLDPSGVSNAQIIDRAPSGSINPDEVLNTQFNFVDQFVSGRPMRLKAFIGDTGTGATLAGNGNTLDFICPGIVSSSMNDADRDKIHAWDLEFDMTGGDYDPSASGEAPGNDNEFTIIYR